MPTECTPDFFGFEPVEGREVVAAFDAGAITSDAGALLLGATDRAIKMMDRFASCFHDVRRAELIEHEVATLVGQRVFGIALGYEDLNDHDELRHDPMMAVLAGKLEARREDCAPVAGKSTLNRLELSRLEPTRYHRISHNPVAIKGLLVDLFLEAHKRAPTEIILDLDATDDPLHGDQEGRFFHGYYDCYCYLPLYVFCGRHLLAAKLRRANIDAAAGSVQEVARIVAQIRARWPRTRILLRADSGFAREELMAWCEANGVDYLFGLAKKPIRASSSPRSRVPSAKPDISTRRSIAPAATWRIASRSANSTSMPTAPRPPPCGQISCACGLPRWPTFCSAPSAVSDCITRSLPKQPAAPFVSSCSRSALSCASASAVSKSRWRRAVPQPTPGGSLPPVSPHQQTPAPRPPDTRRRSA